MTGKTVSHYRMVETPGGGSAGAVYDAENTKFARSVGLKFLSEELFKDLAGIEDYRGL